MLMKNILALFVFTTISICAFAQENNRPEEIQEIINDNQERFVFEFTADRATGDEAPEITALSRGFNVYYMKNIPLGESKFAVAPGLGLATRQLYMKQVYDFDPQNNMVSLKELPEGLDRNVSKLSFNYIEAPIELRFSTTPDKRGHSFKLATGFRAGYMISSKFKYKGQVYDGDPFVNDSGDDFSYSTKIKEKKLQDLVNYRIAPTVRIGYGSVNLFGLYQINSDFDSGRGPKYNAYSIGVSISSF